MPTPKQLRALGVKSEADITQARGRTAEKRQQARAPKLAQARGETSVDRLKSKKTGVNTPTGPKPSTASTRQSPSANRAPAIATGAGGGLKPETSLKKKGSTISRNRTTVARARTDRKAAIAKEVRKRQAQKSQLDRAMGKGPPRGGSGIGPTPRLGGPSTRRR